MYHSEEPPKVTQSLIDAVEAAWEDRSDLTPRTNGEARDAIETAIEALDRGVARVAEPGPDGWSVNQWLKKAVLLSFRIYDTHAIPGGPIGPEFGAAQWFDKVPSKFAGWGEPEFRMAGFRAVPPATVRRSAYIAPNVVLMPSFVNVGAYVDEGTMIDTWVTVGSCAQVGRNCHISGGVGLGGVLEPLQAGPVVVEDDCFVGARSEIVEGVRVGKGSVVSMGVYIGASTKIVNRDSGEILYGEIPPYSVVVPGSMPGKPLPDGTPGPSLYCAVIVKQVDERTRSKTAINELLRT